MARNIIFFFVSLAFGGLLSFYVGQDSNWDLLNYHIYNPWAYLNHRMYIDLFPAGIQTYYSPILDLPYYYLSTTLFFDHPRAMAFLSGIPFGLNIFIVFNISLIIVARDFKSRSKQILLALVITVIGLSGVSNVSQAGATFNEDKIATFLLLGLLVLIKAIMKEVDKKINWVVFSGICFGLAAGFKLTSLLYAPAGALLTLFIAGEKKQKFYYIAIFSFSFLIAFLILWIDWGIKLYEYAGNPLMPYFNSIFKSDLMAYSSGVDARFLPKDIIQYVAYPYYWLMENNYVSELKFSDPRFAISFTLMLASFLIFSYRKIFSGCKSEFIGNSLDRALLLFFVISYYVWELLFSIFRYTAALESIIGVVIYITINFIVNSLNTNKKETKKIALTAIVLLLVLPLTKYIDWGHVAFGEKMYSIKHDKIKDKSMVIFSEQPMAYLAPFMSSGVKDVSFATISPWTSGNKRGLERMFETKLETWDGNFYYISYSPVASKNIKIGDSEFKILNECTSITSNLDSDRYLCEVKRISDKHSH